MPGSSTVYRLTRGEMLPTFLLISSSFMRCRCSHPPISKYLITGSHLLSLSSGGAVEAISDIKDLLVTIFDRYKTDMRRLGDLVEERTGDSER